LFSGLKIFGRLFFRSGKILLGPDIGMLHVGLASPNELNRPQALKLRILITVKKNYEKFFSEIFSPET